MNRQSSRPARGALTGLGAAVIALATTCTPDNAVTPGAPILTAVTITENGATTTVITPDVADCPAGTADTGGCDLTISLCRLPSANNWCRCAANPEPAAPEPPPSCTDGGAPDADVDAGADASTADAGTADASTADASTADAADDAGTDATAPAPGTWNCAPFAPNSTVLYSFDRLLGTSTLDPAGSADTAALTIDPAPTATITSSTDYSPNGVPNAILYPLLGAPRLDAPSLLVTGQPELPANATITVALDPSKVMAKDGKTPFAASGAIAGGSITFTTAPFGVAFTSMPTPPDDGDACTPPLTDAVPDSTPVVATFNNAVDASAIQSHIAVTSMSTGGGPTAAVAVEVSSDDGVNVNIVPAGGGTWPASSTIEVDIDATAADLIGDTLGGPVTTSFTTSAM